MPRQAKGQSPSVAGAHAGRPRDDLARQAILTATTALLEEVGFDKFRIESLAARAGVAKTTIYRWWPNKGALALEAFMTGVAPKIAFVETATPLDDLRTQVQKVGKLYRGKTGRLLCELVALGQADADMHRHFLDVYVTPLRHFAKKCLQRALAAGLLRSDIDLDVMVDAIYGPIWYRMILKHGPINAAYVDALLDIALQGLVRPVRR